MFSQVRSGAIDIFTIGSPIVNAVPIAAITSIAFAFPTFDQVWAAVDGDLGAHVRSAIGTGINLIAFEKMWDNGYRQITTSSKPITKPNDLKGMKLRVPVSPLFTSMFKALGTAPTAINFVEVYSALQTKLVDGQENPLALIDTAKFYEVQKFCSLTSHMWEGFWMVANRRSWERLPDDLRATAQRLLNEGAVKQRADMVKLNATLEDELKKQGADLQQCRQEAVPGGAAHRRLLCRVEAEVRRRGLGDPGEIRRRARLSARWPTHPKLHRRQPPPVSCIAPTRCSAASWRSRRPASCWSRCSCCSPT